MSAKPRTLSAAALARILKTLVKEPEYTVDLGDGFKAVQMAEKSGLIFEIKRGRDVHALADAPADELAEISAIIWARLGPFMSAQLGDDDLTPDELKEKPDPLAGTIDGLTPYELRDTPDALRESPEDPNDLTPDNLK